MSLLVVNNVQVPQFHQPHLRIVHIRELVNQLHINIHTHTHLDMFSNT
jgi:hypothetical protein